MSYQTRREAQRAADRINNNNSHNYPPAFVIKTEHGYTVIRAWDEASAYHAIFEG
jgi:hypothetical protein